MKFLPNGQWTLSKSDEPKMPSIHGLMGKTHTVEVHPDVDHLYNIKNLIKSSGKPHMQLGDIKRSGIGRSVIDRVPRDAGGKVTPEMIDAHIKGLPKKKVEVKVAPYNMEGWQQHRKEVPQYVASIGLHGDTLKSMSEPQKKAWDHVKDQQHSFEGGHENQIGWARIDPYKMHDGKPTSNDKHWHLDEIQSDHHKDNLKRTLAVNPGDGLYAVSDAQSAEHPLHHLYDEATKTGDWDKFQGDANKWAEAEHAKKGLLGHKKMHQFLAHGHEDTQHLIHSAINELARQNQIDSTSLNVPEDQYVKNQLGQKDGQGGSYENQAVPSHQVAVYKKRPQKLHATNVDKKSILGESPEDVPNQQLQYMKLHKNLRIIIKLLTRE